MDKKDPKKNFHFSFKKITKIYLPIALTIFIVFNIPIMPDSLGSNTNFNFQPASASGESYFFADNLGGSNNAMYPISIKSDSSSSLNASFFNNFW